MRGGNRLSALSHPNMGVSLPVLSLTTCLTSKRLLLHPMRPWATASPLVTLPCLPDTLPSVCMAAKQHRMRTLLLKQSCSRGDSLQNCNTKHCLQPPRPEASVAAVRQPSTVSTVASKTEDGLLELVRQLDSRLPAFSLFDVEDSGSLEDADSRAKALIQEVWEVVDQKYLDARQTGYDAAEWASLRDRALQGSYRSTAAGYSAIRKMLARGLSDPYCRFITPAELADMKKYDVTGIGLNLGTAEELKQKTGLSVPATSEQDGQGVFVVGVSQSSSSSLAGITQGDEVVMVDGRDLSGLSPFQVASLIQERKQAGNEAPAASSSSTVQIQIRKQDGSLRDVYVSLPDEEILSPVNSRLLKSGRDVHGFMRLSSFTAGAYRDLREAISSLEEDGAKHLTLDLRNNRGGLVSEGLEVARLFLGGGAPIVFTQTRSGFQEASVADGAAFSSAPLTVLVNDRTASAAEIVAGALKDNCRALLIGGQTYGKGLIQSVYELEDGSGLVLTVGKYLTPNQVDIDLSGIEPNFGSEPRQDEQQRELAACKIAQATRRQ